MCNCTIVYMADVSFCMMLRYQQRDEDAVNVIHSII